MQRWKEENDHERLPQGENNQAKNVGQKPQGLKSMNQKEITGTGTSLENHGRPKETNRTYS